MLAGGSPGQLQISIKNPQDFPLGTYNFGVTVHGGSDTPINVRLMVVRQLHRVWLPLAQR